MVGLTRLELVTPRLSSVCSNQLSYRPWEIKEEIVDLFFYFARQAQRVVHDLSLKLKKRNNTFSIFHSIHLRRTTCCGFLPIVNLSLRRWSSRRFPYGYLVTTSPSLKKLDSNITKHYILIQSLFGWRDGRCVQGAGTYSPRDCDTRLLRIPASWERVTVLNPNYD